MAPNHHRLRLAVSLLLPLLLPAPCRARDTIAPGQPLRGNETLVSSGTGTFALGFFSPPGSNNTYVGIWYAKLPVRTVVWVANRAAPLPGAAFRNAAATLSVTAGCALAVASANGTTVWSSSSSSASPPCAARIQDDGNLVVYESSEQQRGRVAWQGFDHPTDTLLPGMRLGVDFAAGKNMTLTAWSSPSDPSPGPVVAAMATSGDPEVFIWNGGTKVWRSGPWDGVQFTGVPDTVTYKSLGFSFRFVNNGQEATYSFQVRDPSIVTRLMVNGTGGAGLMQRWTWLEAGGAWNLYCYAPKDQCDAVSPCGPNGVCDTNSVPPCRCLRGFVPRSPAAWALRDGRDGCVRATPLGCGAGGGGGGGGNRTGGGEDGFAVLEHAKVPDTTEAVVDYGTGL
ncbi:unnamed protein product [Urochloa humidicola]